MNTTKLSVLILLTLCQACGSARSKGALDISSLQEAWDANNDPLLLKDHYEVQFSELPLNGELARKPWSDTYWPSYRAGLADRWNDPSYPDPFTYPLARRAQILAMSLEDLKRLSPAEKYDLLKGRLDYPLVKEERQRNHADDPSWYGLCHGWAPAALNFEEPKAVTLASPLGIDIPFGSSDVKALVLYVQQDGLDNRMLGDRCDHDLGEDPSHAQDPECRDTNAGSFHIIVANQLAMLKEGFVADIARGNQVWNQPVFGYASEITGESSEVYSGAAPGTVKIVNVSTSLRYITEIGASWEPKPFDLYPFQEGDRHLQYKLEINGRGEIIGGEWLTDERPDFLWTQKRPVFSGYLKDVLRIYEASIQP